MSESEKPEPLTFDKSKWGNGPWQTEPDRVEFEHAGLPCLMTRGPMGSWCGYAAVPPEHPYYGKSYDDVNVDVHGGLTYAARCSGHICHVPKPGAPADVWWFGFDCAHAWDLCPEINAHLPAFLADNDAAYCDMAYVRAEVESLATQLSMARTSQSP